MAFYGQKIIMTIMVICYYWSVNVTLFTLKKKAGFLKSEGGAWYKNRARFTVQACSY